MGKNWNCSKVPINDGSRASGWGGMLATISRVVVDVVGGAEVGVGAADGVAVAAVSGEDVGVAAVGGGAKAVVAMGSGVAVAVGSADSPQATAIRSKNTISTPMGNKMLV
jgi:hypothetical protein